MVRDLKRIATCPMSQKRKKFVADCTIFAPSKDPSLVKRQTLAEESSKYRCHYPRLLVRSLVNGNGLVDILVYHVSAVKLELLCQHSLSKL